MEFIVSDHTSLLEKKRQIRPNKIELPNAFFLPFT